MIVWLSTIVLAAVVVHIVWLEVICGRRSKVALAATNEQIDSIMRSATARYQVKYGRDPTGVFPIVDEPKAAGKRS